MFTSNILSKKKWKLTNSHRTVDREVMSKIKINIFKQHIASVQQTGGRTILPFYGQKRTIYDCQWLIRRPALHHATQQIFLFSFSIYLAVPLIRLGNYSEPAPIWSGWVTAKNFGNGRSSNLLTLGHSFTRVEGKFFLWKSVSKFSQFFLNGIAWYHHRQAASEQEQPHSPLVAAGGQWDKGNGMDFKAFYTMTVSPLAAVAATRRAWGPAGPRAGGKLPGRSRFDTGSHWHSLAVRWPG